MWPPSWKRKKQWWKKLVMRKGVFFLRKGQGRLAKIAAKYSPNSRFPNTSSGEVDCRCSPGAHQQWVSEWVLLSILYVWNFWHTHSPLRYPSLINAVLPLHTPLHIFTCLSFLPPPLHPSLPFHVLRPESNLQQLSKSGMTDKLIFSSWVYIPGIWAADLAPNKRRVSASCLLKLMFSWPEMNYPVTRIYLYSS